MTDDVRVRVRVDDDTRQGMGSATGGIKGALEQLGPIAAGAGAAMAAGLAVAAAAAVVLKKALDASIERSNVGNLIAAQLGDTGHAAELGKLAGEVYADNFGASLQDAGNAVRDVMRNHLVPEDAADDAIKGITEKLLTVATVAEATSTEVARSAHKMLVTGMAGSAEEALDIITRGIQNGANEAGDLLDTFDEYSIQFKELGLNGKEALGLIGQGLRAGARDADTVADALKEIAIRAQDGSKASATAFQSLGLDAKQLGSMFAAGGDTARTAIDMIIDKTKGVTDPLERNAIAVGLFGTKAEDLQDALFGLDLDTAVEGLGDVAGAADKAGAALGQGLGPMIDERGDTARTAIDMIIDKTKGVTDPLERNAIAVGLFGTKAEDLQDALFGLDLDTAVEGLGDVAGAADEAGAALGQGLGPMIDELKRKMEMAFADLGDEIAPAIMAMVEIYQEAADKLGNVFEGSEVPGEVVDSIRALAHDYLPALREALNYIIDKVGENRASFEAVGRVLVDYVIPAIGFLLVNGVIAAAVVIGSLIDGFNILIGVGASVRNFAITLALTFLGAFDTIVQGAAKAFGWIPGIGPKLQAAAAEVHSFVQRVNNELKNIRDEDVYVRTHFVGGQGQSRGGDYASGGITGAMSYAATGGARGGLVKVGEYGSELIRTPQGSMVYPHANTEQFATMAANGAGGGGRVIEIRVVGDDTAAGRFAVDVLNKAVSLRGGVVQDAVMGRK